MDRPVREKKPTKHYDPAKEAAKPQWKKPKKPKVKKPEKKSVHTYFISSGDEEEPEPPIAGSSSGAHNGPVHTYLTDRNLRLNLVR
jgi:hypothetical protein